MTIRLVAAEVFQVDRDTHTQTDGRTDNHDMTKLTVAFRNFAKAHKIWQNNRATKVVESVTSERF